MAGLGVTSAIHRVGSYTFGTKNPQASLGGEVREASSGEYAQTAGEFFFFFSFVLLSLSFSMSLFVLLAAHARNCVVSLVLAGVRSVCVRLCIRWFIFFREWVGVVRSGGKKGAA
jgi:Ni/Fe-hydrogenase subunit HybB-like protein